MGASKIGWANDERRSTWEPPVVTKVAIGAETKSATPREAEPGSCRAITAIAAGNKVWIFIRDGLSTICPYRKIELALVIRIG